MPTFTSYNGQIVDIYPTHGYDSAVEIMYAAIPVGDIGDVVLNLPDEARDAIVNGALAELLAIPGQNQNIQLSEVRRTEYERLQDGLRAVGVLGMGGTAAYAPPLFGGAGNAFWPYQVPISLPGPYGG